MSVTVWDWYRDRLPAVRPGGRVGVPIAFSLAFIAQYLLARGRDGPWQFAVLLYLAAAIVVGCSAWRDAELPEAAPSEGVLPIIVPEVRWKLLALSALLGLITWLGSGDNHISFIGRVAWLTSLVLCCSAFWRGSISYQAKLKTILDTMRKPRFSIPISRIGLLILGLLLFAASVRFGQLDAAPPEMTSDHVEKLLDINNIINGDRPVFMTNNGGRESMEFYLAAVVIENFGADLSHNTLKLLMAVAGFITIPLVYLLAREITDNNYAGLLAALTLAIGWWPNSISRNGLRFPLAPLFTTLAIWLVIRGLKRSNFNTILLAGLALGIGLYGYTPIRTVPIVLALAIGLHWLHKRHAGAKLLHGIVLFLIVILVMLLAFVPMLRMAVDLPDLFWSRTLTRMTSAEISLQASFPVLFLRNFWNSVRMFSWTSDAAWLVSPPGQPALDWITASVFHLGLAIVAIRYYRHRNWLDLLLLLSLPVLLLPSMLALAFPVENPSLHRSSAALPVVFTFAGISLHYLLRRFRLLIERAQGGARLATPVTLGLLLFIMAPSYGINNRILFEEYVQNYSGSSENASEIGAVIRDFSSSIGDWDTAYVKAYPHWVDVRAVGIYAGRLGWDQVYLDLESMAVPLESPSAKLIVVHPSDEEAIQLLPEVYPEGVFDYFKSDRPNHDFLLFHVPSSQDVLAPDESLLQE